MDALFGILDRIQRGAAHIGLHFQWPCWLLGYAWDWRARQDAPDA